MWWFFKELFSGLYYVLWAEWRHSKPMWLCEPGEISSKGRALMLGAVGGVSGPLVNVRAAQAQAEGEDDGGSSDGPAE